MYPYQDKTLSPELRAEDLVSRMELREKVGQLTQRLYGWQAFEKNGEELTLSQIYKDEVDRYSGLGTLYGLHRADPWSGKDFSTGLTGTLSTRAANMIQKYAIEHSRFGIPVLLSSECPHGHQALDGFLLPVNLAAGCSFDPDLFEEAAKVSGQQLKAMGIHLALVSALDILRDPRWGRSEECFGEDPYLASRMAQAVVRGIQSQGVDVTAKHMCAQGETTGGVNASAARIGERELREIHLPPVKACVEAGVSSFMAAYNEIDGVYCHGNHWLLTDLLRGEYGFRGFVMSDGVAIDQLDAVTGDRMASGALAMNAGVDMGLWDTAFSFLEEAVQKGLVAESRIDEACKRILTVKFRLGLFEHPYVEENDHWRIFDHDRFDQGRRFAEQTPVLLKNEGILPLSRKQKIALIGPNADAIYNQLGDYTPPQREGRGITVRRGLEAAGAQILYHPGCPMFYSDGAMMASAVEAAKEADVIVACLGGSSSRFAIQGEFDSNGALKSQSSITMDCGENVDSASLLLPGDQLELLEKLKALGKPVVTVLIGGRPYEMAAIDRCSDALLCAFYPGPTGGEAIARLLLGDIEPAGRLSVSLPDDGKRLPVYYDHKDSYKPMRYFDGAAAPRYGFGCGLGYTEFAYEVTSADSGAVTVCVTNTGSRPGYAVPQLYVHRTQGIVTSRLQLCGFKKLYLAAGESETVTIPIPRESLEQFGFDMKPVLVPGKICWYLRDSGRTHAEGSFRL